MNSMIGYFNLPLRSDDGGCILGVSAGGASRLGVLAEVDEICLYVLGCKVECAENLGWVI